MVGRHVELGELATAELLAIVDRATSGDRGAAEQLIEGVAPVVRRRIGRALARRCTGGRAVRHELDDLVQQTLAALFADGGRVLRAWNPGRGLGFLGFVGLIAEREVGMTMRSRRRNPWTEEPTAAEALSNACSLTLDAASRIEARDELRRVIARLRDRLSRPGQSYLQWLVLEDRPVSAVARETGARPEALYAWRSRLLRMLREVRRELGAPHERAESARRTGPRAILPLQ